MNDQCNGAPATMNVPNKPQTTMGEKHQALEAAVKSLDKFEKDLYGINDSLGVLANRVNPEDYFGNKGTDASTNDALKSSDGEPKRRIHGDGLVGSMDTHIQQLLHRVEAIQRGISLAYRNINFLQEQI